MRNGFHQHVKGAAERSDWGGCSRAFLIILFPWYVVIFCEKGAAKRWPHHSTVGTQGILSTSCTETLMLFFKIMTFNFSPGIQK